MKYKLIYFVMALIMITASSLRAEIRISTTGNVSLSMDKREIIENTSRVYEITHPTIIDVITIQIAGSSGKNPWRVKVKLDDSEWVDDFEVYVKRTSKGTGAGSITGGSNYVLVKHNYQEFFTGEGDRDNITIQFKLAGVSDNLPSGKYSLPFKFEVVQEVENNNMVNNNIGSGSVIPTYSYQGQIGK